MPSILSVAVKRLMRELRRQHANLVLALFAELLRMFQKLCVIIPGFPP